MLVLTRKSQETVVVGSTDGGEYLLKITVLRIKSGSVVLGFDVAADVPVHRLEVWEQIHTSGTSKEASSEDGLLDDDRKPPRPEPLA